MVNDANVNVFPLVTACDADNEPEANRRLVVGSVSAQWDAFPLAVIAPSVIAGTATCLPFGDPAAGAPTLSPVLLPNDRVDVASV